MKINLLDYPERMKEINNCIYIYTDTRNGMQYVGQAKNLYDRNKRHINNNKSNLFDNIYKKHSECFTLTVIEKFDECTNVSDVLNTAEIYYIAALNTKHPNGYNLTNGGDGVRGYKQTDLQKQKTSQTMKIYYQTEEGIELIKKRSKQMSENRRGENNPFYGKHHTEEAKQKISESSIGENNPFYGKRHTEESKMKMRINKPNKKPVRCVEIGITFFSCNEAKRWLQSNGWPKASINNILRACKNPNMTAYGYHWEFIQEVSI